MLSKKTQEILVVALASKEAAQDVMSAIEHRGDSAEGDPALLQVWQDAESDSVAATNAYNQAVLDVANAQIALTQAQQAYSQALDADPEDPNLPDLLQAQENAQTAFDDAQDAEEQAFADAQAAYQAAQAAQAAYEATVGSDVDVKVSESTKKVLVISLTDEKIGQEVAAAIESGAALSLEAKRRIIIMMANAEAGNELINAIQTVATKAVAL